MNLYVADPDWGWWILAYFYLGGIAAGAYFTCATIELIDGDRHRWLMRMGYLLAVVLIALCGLMLTVDLGQPARFWHMLFRSEVVKEALHEGWPASGTGWSTMLGAPLLKPWSAMSIGSWSLSLFGLCATLSLIGSWWPKGRWTRWLVHGPAARVLEFVGGLAGFFVASYTGTLLSETNQPLWSDTFWLAPLFLTSAASTGMAAMLLLGYVRRGPEQDLAPLERADVWILVLELAAMVGFILSLWGWWPVILTTIDGWLLLVGVLVVGILLPLGLHLFNPKHRVGLPAAAAVLALVGGLLLRYSVLQTGPALLQEGPALLAGQQPAEAATPGSPLTKWFPVQSPEDGRVPETKGADPHNYVGETVVPKSKLSGDEQR